VLDEPQRATEFQPGVPELSSKALERRHGPILQAFASMRLSATRLWSASTVDEALSLAAEELASHFGDAALVGFAHRLAQGRWDHRFIVDRGIGTRNARFQEELASSLTPARYDEIVLYPTLSEPGDVGTLESFAATSVADVYETERVKHNIHRWVLLAARIRSRDGAIGDIMMKHAAEREYSEVDRAVISAIASVASLALS
jgi:hypothetical protein